MAQLTISEIIAIGKVSIYLSANYTDKGALYGGRLIKPTPPVQIHFVTDALEWGLLGGAQTAASLRSTANYALWLYGLFQLQAINILTGGGGGTVIPTPIAGTAPLPLDFIVSSITPIVTGAATLTIAQFIGYNVQFDRGGQPQYTTNPGDGTSYYSWDRQSGAFSMFPEAFLGEPLRITPV